MYLNSGVALEIAWLADALFRRAPITLVAGCRLILSVQEAISHHLTSGSHPVMSTFVAGDELQEEDTYVV